MFQPSGRYLSREGRRASRLLAVMPRVHSPADCGRDVITVAFLNGDILCMYTGLWYLVLASRRVDQLSFAGHPAKGLDDRVGWHIEVAGYLRWCSACERA